LGGIFETVLPVIPVCSEIIGIRIDKPLFPLIQDYKITSYLLKNDKTRNNKIKSLILEMHLLQNKKP